MDYWIETAIKYLPILDNTPDLARNAVLRIVEAEDGIRVFEGGSDEAKEALLDKFRIWKQGPTEDRVAMLASALYRFPDLAESATRMCGYPRFVEYMADEILGADVTVLLTELADTLLARFQADSAGLSPDLQAKLKKAISSDKTAAAKDAGDGERRKKLEDLLSKDYGLATQAVTELGLPVHFIDQILATTTRGYVNPGERSTPLKIALVRDQAGMAAMARLLRCAVPFSLVLDAEMHEIYASRAVRELPDEAAVVDALIRELQMCTLQQRTIRQKLSRDENRNTGATPGAREAQDYVSIGEEAFVPEAAPGASEFTASLGPASHENPELENQNADTEDQGTKMGGSHSLQRREEERLGSRIQNLRAELDKRGGHDDGHE